MMNHYADLGCDCCFDRGQCESAIYPYITGFLDDLKMDRAFHEAVANAESCGSKHRQTLIMLKGVYNQE